ncbi:hypothetical protein [Streptomyces sp. sk2.1]|uniref:hypothetical protein n=1 Tax=Streptomyces sp. sk2.1 TaxID=2478959 RepID=UPI0011E77A35|nr:hypothetical protein [Streptomyces sp. sk2.1]TXS81295.1 hypothetical protein EAO76_00570 [Streptomyces sp. sk2.1]
MTQWHARLRRLRAGEERIDWSTTRVDTFCGRLVRPTTYRLSLFVPDPPPHDPDHEPRDRSWP